MTIDYIPGTTSNLVGDPAEGGAFSSGNKGEIAGANTAAANAGTSATAAAASQAAAAQSASNLSAAETNAGLSSASAQVAAAQASASKNAAAGFLGSVTTIYDDFDDRYLGSKTSDPTLDNDGGALLVGAIYFNSTTNQMKVYNGSAWQITAVDSNAVAFLAGATFTGDVSIEKSSSGQALLTVHNTASSGDADAVVRLDSSANGESVLEFYHDGTKVAAVDSFTDGNPDFNLTTFGAGSVVDIQPNNQTVARFETNGLTVYGDVTAPEFIGVLQGETVFKAKAGEALSKGDAVYVSGISGNTPVVSKADANGANTYPAFGLAAADTANNGTLDVITSGQLKNFDTSGFTLGDTLYLSTTPGVLTATPPTGEGSVIQNMGKVEREHASTGSILVVGSGRTAATPNLNYGNIFIGNLQNKAVTGSFNTLADARIANNIIDEDSFSTNSATRAPSQQSVKQYVADQTANIQGDITNVITGNGLTGGGTSGAVTIAVDTAVVATAGNTLTLNNKTLSTPVISTPDINGGTVDGAAIGGGTVDGAAIGGTTPAAGSFTTLGATGLISGGDLTLTDSTPRIQFNDSDGTDQKTEQVQAGGSFVTTVRNNTSHGSIDFKSNNGTNNLLRFRVATDGDFNFYENNGSTVGVKWDAPNGRLGIGTTSPAHKLHVAGKIIATEGIYLGGTTSPNLLNDYEEGTWTPAYTAETTSPSYTADNLTAGFYTKVGNLVTITGRLRTDNITNTPAGDLRVSGLPFNITDTTYSQQSGTMNIGVAKGYNSNYYPTSGYAVQNSDYFILTSRSASASNLLDLDAGNALVTGSTNKNEIVFSAVYYTDA
ncbi:hypothetical protein N9095_00580 [bacterium]|nr:hypothetical protein [bacterium]